MGSKFSLYADWACDVEKSEKKKMLYLPILESKNITIENTSIDESLSMIIKIRKKEGASGTSKKSGVQQPNVGGIQQKEKKVEDIAPLGVTAVAEGTVSIEGEHSLTLMVKDFFESLTGKIEWFKTWKEAKKMPGKIVYEDLKKISVKNGEKKCAAYGLGEGDKIKISIYYGDGTKMNPIEFFSLLFWQEEYDPVYQAEYDSNGLKKFGGLENYKFESWGEPKSHPLINKMMSSRMNGSPGTPEDDDWMGLRPPLRTYKRIEWEAKRELSLYFNNWQQLPKDEGKKEEKLKKDNKYGDITGRIKTPNIVEFSPNVSKCNILTGELAYRAGFRTFVKESMKKGKLKFYSPNELVRYAKNEKKIKLEGLNLEKPEETIEFGEKRNVTKNDIDEINREIGELGKCLVYAREGYEGVPPGYKGPPRSWVQHVVILKEIKEIKDEIVEAAVIDQHLRLEDGYMPRRKGNVPYLGCSGPDGRIFIELLPGDDPKWE
ncbi:hypothetical protein KEJ17_04040 [Candidatus Bathyarchaeota archaeon]|nr:hypothetical protein [Candidatus Bathyarchaeota archaeon]